MTPANKNYLGVSLVGLAIIVFWVFEMPTWNRISLLRNAIAERETIFSERKNILTKIEALNKQYQDRTVDIARISSIVPSTKGTAELVSTIEAITQQTGFQLVEMTMGSGSGRSENKQEMQIIPIELGLTGSYSSLTAFLDLLEKNLRIIDVYEISISQTGTPGAQIVLNFRIKANTYYLIAK